MKSRSLFLCLIVIALQLPAATVQWTNSVGGNWSEPANWFPNRIPSTTDEVLIAEDGTYTVNVDVVSAIAGLTLGAQTGTQSLAVSSGNFVVTGPAIIGTNGVFEMGTTLTATNGVTVHGTFEWTGGTINAGTYLLNHHGRGPATRKVG